MGEPFVFVGEKVKIENMKPAAVALACVLALAACGKHGASDKTAGAASPAAPAAEQVPAPGTAPADLTISANVNAAFQADPALRLLEIGVATAGGVVTLSGSINTRENSERAAQIAGTVAGVKSVDNRLRVRAPG